MKPTWTSHDGSVTLYNADCLKIYDTLPKDAAIISDPPYGIGYFHNGGGGANSSLGSVQGARDNQFSGRDAMIHGDDVDFDPTPWLPFSPIVLFGGNHFSDKLPQARKWLVWDKVVHPETYGKFSFSDCEIAWTDQGGVARIYHHLWQGCRRAGESNKNGKLHPNRKPVELMMWCMGQVNAGNIVIDPYMGSGTTGVACVRTGRSFIGIEIDPGYFEIAVKRIDAECRQMKLF